MEEDILGPIINFEKPKIHIRITQRSGRHSFTTVEDLPQNLRFKEVLSAMKKNFHCNGGIQNPDNKKIIQLFGDQRMNIKKFLLSEEIVTDENDIIVHGF